MLLSLVFIVSSFVFGWFLGFNRGWQRVGFALIAGFVFSSWLALILAVVNGELNSLTIGLSILILWCLILACRLRAVKLPKKEGIIRVLRSLRDIKGLSSRENIFSIISILTVLAFIFYINIFDMFVFNRDGYLLVTQDAWADQAFHIGLIESLARDGSFILNYPMVAGVKLTYPFIADFISSVLLKTGLSLRDSVVVPNILLGIALVIGVYSLALAVGGKKSIAAATVLLFFFNGGPGFIYVISGALKPVMRDFTHITERQLVFENLINHFLFSQRSILLGLGVSVAVYLLLLRAQENGSKRELFLAGSLAGLLPLIHTHSFIAVSIVSLFLFLRKPRVNWLYFILPFVLLSAPQLLRIEHQSGTGFLQLKPGWVPENEGKNLLEIAWFWVKNTGLPLLLAIGGFILADRKTKFFYLPFAAIFLIANVFVFQPNPYDNNKLFLHWMLATDILAAIFLFRLYHWQGWQKRRAYHFMPVVLVSLFLFVSIFSGFLTNVWAASTNYGLYSPQELEMGEWIRNSTPPDSIFLTGFSNQNPVFLAGRQIFLGSWWYTSSHFIDRSKLEEDVKIIYASGDCELIKKYKIDYVLISPKESDLNPNSTAVKTKNFQQVYSKKDTTIYKTRC